MLHPQTAQPRGQILLMVGFGVVVLLGILALAFDLGFSWMLHRKEQNAADPGAIAAARWLKDALGDAVDPTVVQDEMNADACFYAQQNGFFVTDVGCAAALAAGDLQVHSPPVNGPYAGAGGRVQVIIHDTHPTFFARMWGQTEAAVVTSAVAANDAGNGNSSSLVALQPVCEAGSAGTITGGGTVTIFPTNPGDLGGYVHVNSPCGGSTDDSCLGGGGPRALDINGGSTLVSPFVRTVGSCATNGGGSLECDPIVGPPCLDENAGELADPLAVMPPPSIDDFPAPQCPDPLETNDETSDGCTLNQSTCPVDLVTGGHVCTLEPGVYYGGWFVKQNVKVELEPGMYILAGGGIRVANNSVIESVQSDTGIEARVTIFSTDGPACNAPGDAQCQGAITFVANAGFKAKATNTASCQAIIAAGGENTCPWKGILLWQDGKVKFPGNDLTLGGQSSSILAGTIYAPLSDVHINGGNGTTGCTGPVETQSCLSIQIVSYRWTIDGDAEVAMPYDPAEIYQFPARGLIH
jgi:hypothetical protein